MHSITIASIVAIFIGAVSSIQTAANLVSPFVPMLLVGTLVRDMEILELEWVLILLRRLKHKN